MWSKKGAPTQAFISTYNPMPPLPRGVKAPPRASLEKLKPLLNFADATGRLVQYSHQGFLPNKRQQRMAGLAATELAQTLLHLVRKRKAGVCRQRGIPPMR